MSEPRESDSGENKDWVGIQKKTFTKWMNNHLMKKGYKPIGDCLTDFEDGIKLMELINALYPDCKIPKTAKFKPEQLKMRPQKLDNINIALDMVTEAKIKTNFLKNTHLIDKDLKMILGMIWAIILDFAIKGISVEELTAKEGLLLWCRKKTAGYKGVDPPTIRNFRGDWKSGLAFCALIHRHRPDLIDYDSLNGDDNLTNLELAFSVAEKELGIPRLLDVEDFKGVPDERSVMTYVSEYFHRFASSDQKEIAAQRLVNFLRFTKGIQERQNEYERRARALVSWVGEQVGEFKNRDFGNTLGEAQAAQANLRDFVVSRKPVQEGEKIDLENLFAEIQTQLKVNNRKAYVPPSGLAPDDLEAALDDLVVSQKAYAKAVRENRYKFVTKTETKLSDEKIKEIEASFKHFDANKSNTLDKTEFKAALSAMSVFFTSEADFNRAFDNVAQGGTHISLEAYTAYLTSKYQDKDTPEQLKESFKAVAEGADTISLQQLNTPPLDKQDVEYLASVMPKAGSGFDYSTFVNSNYE